MNIPYIGRRGEILSPNFSPPPLPKLKFQAGEKFGRVFWEILGILRVRRWAGFSGWRGTELAPCFGMVIEVSRLWAYAILSVKCLDRVQISP